MSIGNEMYALCDRLFPICRSITGNGVRETLRVLQSICPAMTLHEVPTGTQVFDWTVPKEWNIRDAWIKNSKGEKILDFAKSNLHVMGYSIPVNQKVTREELLPLIHTQPDQPDAIPYVTSYYKERYGFCMSQEQKDALQEDTYHIYIDSDLKDGSLTYGEILIPSTEGNKDEIFLSTYVCHPSMANNELSGPAVTIYLAKWLWEKKHRRYNYRIIFIPETIGAITYLSQHLPEMKKIYVLDSISLVWGMIGRTLTLPLDMAIRLLIRSRRMFCPFVILNTSDIRFFSEALMSASTTHRV